MTPSLQSEPGDAVKAAHHQIGNSLQSVASLLSLQGRSAGQPAATLLLEASRRVSVIVRLHQRLQTGAADEVCLDLLLGDICRDVAEISETGRDVTVRLNLEPMLASSTVASALGLIAAEWLGNALEHAFTTRKGTVRVALISVPEGLQFSVHDDGRNPTGCRVHVPGFGLTLVSRLGAQLHGQVDTRTSDNGTSCVLTAPGGRPDPEARPCAG